MLRKGTSFQRDLPNQDGDPITKRANSKHNQPRSVMLGAFGVELSCEPLLAQVVIATAGFAVHFW